MQVPDTPKIVLHYLETMNTAMVAVTFLSSEHSSKAYSDYESYDSR